jgi:hypothetical protein
VIVAPDGIESTAVLRDCASVTVLLAFAAAVSSSERQKTSGAVSEVFVPQALTAPTRGAGTPVWQFCPSVLPSSTKSPFWFTW